MSVQFENFAYTYNRNGKPIFVPNEKGRRLGEEVKGLVEATVQFDEFYHHLRKGGHVRSLHAHRANAYFARLDIERFFYSIGRNRVVRTLRESKITSPARYGKWSCVKNPYQDPTYSLPYGFVQSPILASLALMTSGAGQRLRDLSRSVTVSVYMDDISISSDSLLDLEAAYADLRGEIPRAGFKLNEAKSRDPSASMDVFNCDLIKGASVVMGARIEEFYSVPRSEESAAGFERYKRSVERGNAGQAPPSDDLAELLSSLGLN